MIIKALKCKAEPTELVVGNGRRIADLRTLRNCRRIQLQMAFRLATRKKL